MFRDVPGCSGMFRDVPGCSGMFHVPDFIDAPPHFSYHQLMLISALLGKERVFVPTCNQ